MNVVELLTELVAIPSVNPGSLPEGHTSDGEQAMAEKVESVVRQIGAASVEVWQPLPGRPTVLAYFDFAAPRTLIFDAHLDTVPVEGMTVAPFTATHLDGKIFGRGACDVKGPMAAMLCAINNVARTAAGASAPRYNVLFAAVCDEESGFGGVSSFVNRLQPGAYAPLAGAVIAEPTLLNVVAAHKGVLRWHIGTRGVAAHSSTPHLGSNAIYAMSQVIARLQEYADQLAAATPHVQLGAPSLSVGLIHGGSAVNIVPDFCEIQVDRRLIPGETVESATADLWRQLDGLGADVSSPIVAAPPMHTDSESFLVKEALAAGRHAGAQPQIEYANYCTDGSFYPALNLPSIVTGPGSIAQAHTKDEWIEIDQLHKGVAAYEALIRGIE